MHEILDDKLEGKKTEKEIIAAIEEAFDKLEADLLEMARGAYKLGFPQSAYVGSCALVAVVKGDKVYVANSGDCKGVIMRKKAVNYEEDIIDYEMRKITTTFNANKKAEQERLRKKFPDDKDIVICKRGDSKACYVKGNLQPTKSFGDFRLKHDEFNKLPEDRELGYRRPVPDFKGPYIEYKPEIKVFDITSEDHYLILATDGLWDCVKRKNVGRLIKKKHADPGEIATVLYESAIKKVMFDTGVSREFLSQVAPGPDRRRLLDDMTVLILTLED